MSLENRNGSNLEGNAQKIKIGEDGKIAYEDIPDSFKDIKEKIEKLKQKALNAQKKIKECLQTPPNTSQTE